MWIRGVAPKVWIIPVLVLDAWEVPYPGGTMRFTGGTDEMVAAGIRYVAELAETYHVKIIINMSLGGTEPAPLIEDAINYAISKGVIIVAAAGNEGEAGMVWPGAYSQVISAAAGGWTMQWVGYPPSNPPSPYRWWLTDVPEKLNTVDDWGNNWQIYLEEFSSRPNPELGQFWKDLDVCTPGASIVGPYKPYFSTAVGYYYLWGTSMATPHVSAIAALVAEKYPSFNQFDMEWVLKKAAAMIPLASDGAIILDPWGIWDYKWNDHDYGSGWLQADNAFFAAFVYTRGKPKAIKAYAIPI
jgi:subtilisin family serine protease